MSVRAWSVAIGTVSIAVLAVVACVGDDPSPKSGVQPDESVPKGEQGGRCNAGRCLSGLYCDTVNDVCLIDPDGGGTGDGGTSSSGGSSGASSSGGSSSGAGSSSSGSTNNPCPYDAGPTAERACLYDNATCGLPTCCLYTDQSVCMQNAGVCKNTNQGKPIACVGNGSCPAGHSCCLATPRALDGGACNTVNVAEPLEVYCHDAGACPTGDDRVCRNDDDCTGSTRCVKLTVTASAGSLLLGTCF